MWIVSQDKEMIVNSDNVENIDIVADLDGTGKVPHKIYYETSSKREELGCYATEERAKEILENYFDIDGSKAMTLELGKASITCYVEDINFEAFETIHNYISFEDNIVRKGAISAKKGERVLIPINMRDGSIIAIGKGNEDWNNSAPHGAGRIMSRHKAKEMFKLEEFRESMKDIYTTSVVEETIDEAPFVYKPMQEIIDNIQDTVEIQKIIRPIYNFKAKN